MYKQSQIFYSTKTDGKQDLPIQCLPLPAVQSFSFPLRLFRVYSCSFHFPFPFQPTIYRLPSLHSSEIALAKETVTSILSNLMNTRLTGPLSCIRFALSGNSILHWFPSHHSLRILSILSNLSTLWAPLWDFILFIP